MVFDQWDPQQQPLREALCTLGNGVFATRGAFEEMDASPHHYPGTYLAGGYNRLTSSVAGQEIENEDLVNWPNWLCLNFKPEKGDWFRIDQVELLKFRQELIIENGLLRREMVFRDQNGRETELISERFVHMDYPHIGAIQWRLRPLNWKGRIVFRSALDGRVKNQGVARYRKLNSRHLRTIEKGVIAKEGIYLLVEATQSNIRMAQAARTHVLSGELVETNFKQESDWVSEELLVVCKENQTIQVEKVVSLFTSKDLAISEPLLEAKKVFRRAGTYDSMKRSHSKAWQRLWKTFDLQVEADQSVQENLKIHIFHLLQTISLNSLSRDMGAPARGLHGEAYRGHIFWDELFIFPLYNLHLPDITRHLLYYRYNRLHEARVAARNEGLKGAMFPWQSGSNGREESQVIHLNPKSGRWIPDHTFRQRHVNSAIAYNIWNYYQVTNDEQFISCSGAEMFLEIARFWASMATYNKKKQRYEILNIVGPDEFHTAYPNSSEIGINNNTYTNFMAAWVLMRSKDILHVLNKERQEELFDLLNLSEKELQSWDGISRNLYIPFNQDGIPLQFEGYDKLLSLEWEYYRLKYSDVQRMDRLLELEGKDPNAYQAGKQADVLMLLYLFSAEMIEEVFKHMNYKFDSQKIPEIIDYYLERSSHGSTLSHITTSWVLSRAQRPTSWKFFENALNADIGDIQNGTTSEGIHLGAMAGTVDLIQRCYTGLIIRDDVLWLDPLLPEQIKSLNLRIKYKNAWLRLKVNHQEFRLSCESDCYSSVKIGVEGKVYALNSEELVFPLKKFKENGHKERPDSPRTKPADHIGGMMNT